MARELRAAGHRRAITLILVIEETRRRDASAEQGGQSDTPRIQFRVSPHNAASVD